MNTINRKKSVIAAVGAAVAAAPATTEVTAAPTATGVTVHIKSTGIRMIAPLEAGGPGELNEATLSGGWCTYRAVAGFIEETESFYLEPGGTVDLSFPGIPTGTTWDVTIDCGKGLDSPTQQVVY
ncbi:MAG TPA: hypothetical protein VHI10_06815 [Mycobacterium sp.]|nr:hypothetical protein [Mycobacterium sp.]